jgi:CMP-N,N'-diacetyllegionaminic acid synthase
MKKILCIIPARGGSKGIKDKNIKIIGGKHLIEYTIEQALDTKLFDKIVVSSDSQKILDIASKYPVESFNRNSEIATDVSPISDTIKSVISELKVKFDYIVLLQPTSPIRLPMQINEAFKIFMANKKANSLVSVCEMDDIHPGRMYWKNPNSPELMEPIFPKFETMRRQDLPPALFRNGAMYMVKTKEFEIHENIIVNPVMFYSMPQSQLLNIDHPRDLEVAEVLLRYNGILK